MKCRTNINGGCCEGSGSSSGSSGTSELAGSEIFVGGLTQDTIDDYNLAGGGDIDLVFSNYSGTGGISRGGLMSAGGAYTVGRAGVYSVGITITDEFNVGVVVDTKREFALDMIVNGTLFYRAYSAYYGNDENTGYLQATQTLSPGDLITFQLLSLPTGTHRLVEGRLAINLIAPV